MNRDAYDAIAPQWEQVRIRLSDAERRVFALLCEDLAAARRLMPVQDGKWSALPSGMVQARVVGAAVPPQSPARNHTTPCCPTMQLSPVSSANGLTQPE